MQRDEKAPTWSARWSFRLDAAGRARMYRTLAILLRNRVLMLEALNEMWGVYSQDGKKPSVPIALFLDEASRELQEGGALSTVLARWVAPAEAALLASAEKTGDWDAALSDAMRLVDAQRGIAGAVIGGSIYPLMQLLTIAFTLYAIASRLVPELEKALPSKAFGGVTGVVFAAAHFVQDYGVWVACGSIAMLAVCLWSLPRWTGNGRYRVERVIPWSLYRVMQGVPFLIGVAVMLRARVQLMHALDMLETKASPYMRERITAVRRGIARGVNFGVALHDAEFDFPDRETIRFVRLLAGREGFESALLEYADAWMRDSVASVQRTMRVLGTVAMVVTGVLIASVILSSMEIQAIMQSMNR